MSESQIPENLPPIAIAKPRPICNSKKESTDLLIAELNQRQLNNSAYSLRAYARDLHLSTAHLSRVLSGTRLLSDQMALEIIEQMSWDAEKKDYFLLCVKYDNSDPKLAQPVLMKLLAHHPYKSSVNFEDLNLQSFSLMSDWYFNAIVELAKVLDGQLTPTRIAQCLDITLPQAQTALKLLLNQGLLKQDSDQGFVPNHTHHRILSVPSESIRKFHRQHLQKALYALDHEHPLTRDITGITLAFNRTQLAEAREHIRKFRKEMLHLFSQEKDLSNNNPKPDAVFHLAVQFYQLDKTLE